MRDTDIGYRIETKALNDWLIEDSLPATRKGQRLTAFAIAVLAARAALANAKLNLAEYQLVGNVVKDFSTLSDEDSSKAAHFALLTGQSKDLMATCVEVVTYELDEHEFTALLIRLTEILTLDHALCERDIEFLYELYLRTCEAMTPCAFRSSTEKDRYCARVLSFIRKETSKVSDKRSTQDVPAKSNVTSRRQKYTGSSFETQSLSGRLAYSAQMKRG
jgi:hypothetical protein